MPYTKTQWVNDTEPSIDASHLNKIEQGIYDAQNLADTNATALGGHTVAKDVPADAKFTDTVYDDTALSGRVSAVETSTSANATAITALQGRATQDETRISANEANIATLMAGADYFIINDTTNDIKYKCQIQIINGKPMLAYEIVQDSEET